MSDGRERDLALLEERLAELARELGADLNNADEREVCEDLLRQEQFLGGRRQFPFDEVCERIVRELERRNWQVPGIKVKFKDWGKTEPVKRMVYSITGKDFSIESLLGLHICIPRKNLNVYDDESGPAFFLYVGDDWERDREEFMHGCSKCNSKLEGRPKTYLWYRGACYCPPRDKRYAFLADLPHTHPGQRPPFLDHYNDLEREYDPEGDEPKFFLTDEVMEEFRRYLEDVVLPAVLAW